VQISVRNRYLLVQCECLRWLIHQSHCSIQMSTLMCTHTIIYDVVLQLISSHFVIWKKLSAVIRLSTVTFEPANRLRWIWTRKSLQRFHGKFLRYFRVYWEDCDQRNWWFRMVVVPPCVRLWHESYFGALQNSYFEGRKQRKRNNLRKY
jgi:hypothetical protein